MGRSSLVLDVVVETGNPADSERCLPMLERHVERYGEPPQWVARPPLRMMSVCGSNRLTTFSLAGTVSPANTRRLV